jgi:hypothetical protein
MYKKYTRVDICEQDKITRQYFEARDTWEKSVHPADPVRALTPEPSEVGDIEPRLEDDEEEEEAEENYLVRRRAIYHDSDNESTGAHSADTPPNPKSGTPNYMYTSRWSDMRCPVCEEPFTKTKPPVLLGCTHHSCETCFLSKRFQCTHPSCREPLYTVILPYI